MKVAARLIIVLLFAGFCIAIGAWIGLQIHTISQGKETLFTSQQPEGLSYQSFDPYCVTLYKQKTLGNREGQYSYQIVRCKDNNYGHYGAFSYSGMSDTDLQKAMVTWTEDGVQLNLPSSYVLFVPKGKFIGGR